MKELFFPETMIEEEQQIRKDTLSRSRGHSKDAADPHKHQRNSASINAATSLAALRSNSESRLLACLCMIISSQSSF